MPDQVIELLMTRHSTKGEEATKVMNSVGVDQFTTWASVSHADIDAKP
jgi:hypothetical protein